MPETMSPAAACMFLDRIRHGDTDADLDATLAEVLELDALAEGAQ